MKRTLLVLVVAACGSKSNVPEKPYTGAPIAFEVTSFHSGGKWGGKIDVRAYNFSDRVIASYSVMIRSLDANGKRIPVDKGSYFDHESMSFMGPSYKCEPKTWCTFSFDGSVAPDAKSVVVLADRLIAVKDDGLHMDEEPLFKLDGMQWPEPTATAKAAAN